MVNQLLISLVNSVLGSGKKTARGNMAYTCPYCHHHKPKLEVNFTVNKEKVNPWHCWVCNKKGKSILQLLRQAGASQDKINEAKTFVKDTSYVPTEKNIIALKLPSEYKRLDQLDNNITKYDIGYCENGLYENMIIIPTYNKEGRLNYFTARSFDKNAYIKYRNPKVSRDIIPNEHLINWRLPIIICEGLFDAIAIKRNAVPLLGKNIQSELMKKIVSSFVDKIYIALDKDAIKQALHFCENLMMEGKEVYFVDLQYKDPSEMGFKNFTKLIQNTVPMTYSSLVEQKLAV